MKLRLSKEAQWGEKLDSQGTEEDKAGQDGSVRAEASQSERKRREGCSREEIKYGEVVTHSSGGKALIYSPCLFWVIFCGCVRVSISTWPLGAEA